MPDHRSQPDDPSSRETEPEREEQGARLDRSPERDARTGRAAAAERIRNQAQWVDLQIHQAQERGDFHHLPGFGKPIESLGHDHDPDWWLRQLIEREQISGVLPPALQLRKDDAELDDRLDREGAESEVRRLVEDFNARVRKALYGHPGGPPLVTRQRDVDAEVVRWHERRAERAGRAAQVRDDPSYHDAETSDPTEKTGSARRRWFRRRPRHPR